MGIFSSIGNAIGGLVKNVIPAVGTIFSGPVGGAVGSVLSGGLSFLDDNIGSIAGGIGQYYSAEQANQATAERLAQQNQYNVTNAATANQYAAEAQARQFDYNQTLQSRAIAENRSTVDRAMQFERDMSNTAYQRATADLGAAGLNRILAISQGGASTPNAPAPSAPSASVGASSPQAAGAGFSPALEKFGPAMATAMQVATFDQTLKNLEADNRIKLNQAELLASQRNLTEQDALYRGAQTITEYGRPALIDAQRDQAKSSTTRDYSESDLARQRTKTEEQNTRVQAREAKDTERYGTSRLGREAAAVMRMFDTIWQTLRGM